MSKFVPTKRTRVLIVDGQPLLRSGLAAFLNAQPELMVCGEAADPRKAMVAIHNTQPDLVICDVALPGKGGIELIKDIYSLRPELPVLVFSIHPEVQYVERVLLAGGRGYVLKTEDGPALLQAIRQTLRGKLAVNAEMSAHLIEHYTGGVPARGNSPIARLSDRELQILEMIGSARPSREIAKELIISIKTVESHRANIKQKLNVHTAQELMRMAVCWVEARRASPEEGHFPPMLPPRAEGVNGDDGNRSIGSRPGVSPSRPTHRPGGPADTQPGAAHRGPSNPRERQRPLSGPAHSSTSRGRMG